MAKVLQLQYLNEENKTVTFTVNDPNEAATESEISAAMDTILAQNVIQTTGGRLMSKKGAQFVERNVTVVQIG